MDMNWIDGTDDGQGARVFLIKVARQVMRNNNYLVVDPVSRQAVLVDPAWQMEKIQSAVAYTGAQVRGILLTHSHPDHVDLAKPLAELHDCPIWMSSQEIEASGFQSPRLQAVDGTPWTVGRMTVQPILTPGHTPGCVCYLVDDHLFTGDVLFVEGCGLCPDEPAAHAMYASLEMLKARLAPHTRVFPGHTYLKPPGLSFREVRNRNMYLHFADKDSFATFRLRKGQDPSKLMAFR